MPSEKISIANLSWLNESTNFLLQVSKKSERLTRFIKEDIPDKDKNWLLDLKSWEIKKKWVEDVAQLCSEEFDQAFIDVGEEYFDLTDPKDFKRFEDTVK